MKGCAMPAAHVVSLFDLRFREPCVPLWLWDDDLVMVWSEERQTNPRDKITKHFGVNPPRQGGVVPIGVLLACTDGFMPSFGIAQYIAELGMDNDLRGIYGALDRFLGMGLIERTDQLDIYRLIPDNPTHVEWERTWGFRTTAKGLEYLDRTPTSFRARLNHLIMVM
ncbi:MAG: hypothetical protein UZ21_OP11001000465 [Microgenomates bacterium OLB22]|nr:MAG: hypothetical protein UZ21_OP11001000465 [Microgenomates bacterium OLB22]